MKERHSQYIYLLLSLYFLFISSICSSQEKIPVVDENQDPLIGVYIQYGSDVATTDYDGYWHYNLDVDKSTIVKLSYIGYQDLQLSLSQINNGPGYIMMTPSNKVLDEVVIVGRTNARAIDLPYNVRRIRADEIRRSQVQNSADALILSGGAYIQKSQMGGGSPVLRGFEANKILLVVDGVRLNNAIYRSGHLQNAITIDASILEQAEVIFGPGSLMYGSEALGGVVHYRTRSPLLNVGENRKPHLINADLRYTSSNREKRIHLDHTYSSQKWGVLTSVTFSDFDDLRTGQNRNDIYPTFGTRSGLRTQFVVTDENGEDEIVDNPDPHIQIGTGYNQFDFLQKYVASVSDNIKAELNLQYSTSSDIPRYDNLIERTDGGLGDLRFSRWDYGPQDRLLISPKLNITGRNKFFDKAYIITAFQKIGEDRISRRVFNPSTETQDEEVKVWSATLDFNKRLNRSQKITYGIDFNYNDVQSVAFSQIGDNPPVQDILTRYPSGGSQLTNAGVYIQHNLQNRDSTLIWITGLRYTTQKVDFIYNRSDPFQFPEFFYEGITSTSSAVVGITGINYSKNNWTVKASVGNAFRAPNIDDIAKVRVNGTEITIPNTDLKSEKVINSELTIGYQLKNFSIGLTGYYTILSDAIVRESFLLPNGSATFISGLDTLNVVANVNSESGRIRGLSAQLRWDITSNLNLQSSFNMQSGEAESQEGIETPLGHIPPTFGSSTVVYTLPKIELSLTHRYNLWKRIEDYGGSVDNPEFAPLEGTPAWHIFNVDASAKLNNNWSVNVGIYNILDTYYRPFGSALSGAGRHIALSLRYNG
ncbi:TonB-dependent receptor [Saprospiraceae bacterium]|nr:TonB-dependent receptor [Saprospiraceae bacterium]